jgi:hypothetical protein
MSGFQKRVALLEKWAPSLLPKLRDIDDMAEIILDVWDEAEAHTEERIIKLLDEFIENSDLPEVVDRLEWLKGSIKGKTNEPD